MIKITSLVLTLMCIFTLSACDLFGSNDEEKQYLDMLDRYVLRLLEESTPDAPLWNVESTNWKTPKWNYIDGCMMSALLDLYDITDDETYYDFVETFVNYYVGTDGSILGYNISDYNLDNINEGKVLFDLYARTSDTRYISAIETLYTQIENQPRTSEGNFFHKNIYTNQVWLDGLYMSMPFYLEYERDFNNKENYSDIINQITNVKNKMYNFQDKLYYHGYDCTKTIFWANSETGLSQNYWLRSMGWYLMSLVDVYALLDENDLDEKTAISLIFEEALKGIYYYQDAQSKMFYQVINKGAWDGNYLESSGSAMISYASLKAARLGMVSEDYQRYGKEIFMGICKKYLTEVDGKLELDGICLSAGLGPDGNYTRDGSYEYYVSEEIVKNDAKGVAPLVMAYTEILRINQIETPQA